MKTFKVDNRTFRASEAATENSENWRKAFPAVYGHMPAKVAKAFAKRDFERAVR